jgi:hypothetical protein
MLGWCPPSVPPIVCSWWTTPWWCAGSSPTCSPRPGIEVVGVAANGRIALQKIEQLAPTLWTTPT